MAEKRKLAFYIRLSDADEEVKEGTKDESNSITGQRKLLYAYIKKTEEFAGFEVLEYFDDGYSGTMFNNRAEFQRLIQDAELGRFECIIVKDDCVIIEPTQKDLENQGFVAGSICF